MGLLLGVGGAAPAPPAGAANLVKPVHAYWLVASDGGIFAFGGAGYYGSMGGKPLNKPIVGMAGTADSKGYWLVASDGGIFAFGDANYWGSTGGMTLNKPVVAMAATPDGLGYWLVASDGGMFAFGDAGYYGSMGGKFLYEPIVGMAPTPDGKGYWLVASDGGIFAFGDANYWGSTGGMTLNAPIVGMAAMPDGLGYTLVASDGGIFAFGDAAYYGSLGGVPLAHPVVAMAYDPDGKGYWFTDSNGLVSAYGDAAYWGSAPQVLNEPVVTMAEADGSGSFSFGGYPSGSYGYDVSDYQCNAPYPSGDHVIGVVEVEGQSFGPVNSCLADEADWAGAGLNLYVYLTFGNAATSGDPSCAGDQACNYGFTAAQDAFVKAEDAGVNTAVPWWLDVEVNTSWSSDTSENALLVKGAIDGLHAEGLNDVGIYASPANWNGIVGDYQPSAAYWMAWWSGQGGPSNCANAATTWANEQLPNGPIVLTQYSDDVGGFDGDYAC